MRATLLAVVLFVVPMLTHAEPDNPSPNETAITIAAPIHLNTATVDVLTQSFKGIGQKRAEAIIAYRDSHGGFKSIEDLAMVKGIGKSFVDRNLQQLQTIYVLD